MAGARLLRKHPVMGRTTRHLGADGGSFARAGAARGPRRLWFERPRDCEEDAGTSIVTLAKTVIGADSVRRWRFDQLLRAGYPAGDALVLSGRSDVDLHQATRMLRDRCAVATAVAILI